MRAGRQIRWEAALRNWRCEHCGHADPHRELASTLTIKNGTIVETPHPDYRPLEFHCTYDGCVCVLRGETR